MVDEFFRNYIYYSGAPRAYTLMGLDKICILHADECRSTCIHVHAYMHVYIYMYVHED